MSNVDNKHPDYTDFEGEWHLMRHTNRGTKAVKGEAKSYLPMPSGFTVQNDGGVNMYANYMMRAEFPELVSHTLKGMVGVIHKREAQITLPNSMQYLWERASKRGLTLEAFHRRMTAEILLTGREGVLATAPAAGGDPYLVGYVAESIFNWSEDQDFFVLDETYKVRDGYNWDDVPRFRVLEYTNQYTSTTYDQQGNRVGDPTNPRGRGDRELPEIPFVVVGSRDLHVDPEEPPLIGVARAALEAYRLDADYKHQMFWSGQETLFITGVDDTTKLPSALGAGVQHGLPVGADAKYVGPSCRTIEAHRLAIQDARTNAAQAGARLFDTEPTQRVSGEALKFRDAARNATLASVAIACGAGLEKALRYVAMFLGESPESVVVKPNLEFVDRILTPTEAEALVRMWQQKGISKLDLYEDLKKGGIVSEERDFNQYIAELAKNAYVAPTPVNNNAFTTRQESEDDQT
jgi:hypothetical protein